MISNRTRAARLFDFEITRMISDQIALHSVQLPLSIEQQSDQFGSIELDRFLVRFRSIGYAGLNSIYREQFRDSTSPEHMA